MDSRSVLFAIVTWIVSISVIVSTPVKSLFDYPDMDDRLPPPPSNLFDLSCDPCTPGWGVKTLCNRTNNTVCFPCPAGTWSPKRPHFRPCTPCSKCGDGLYEDIPCTNTRDTKCDSCANVKGHLNEDYKRKCDWRRAPESLKQASEEEVFEEDEYDEEEEETAYLDDDDNDIETKNGDGEGLNRIAVPIFSEEAIRNRIVALGNAALDKFGRIKDDLMKESDLEWEDNSASWSDEEVENDGMQVISAHIMRPLPRMMPRNEPLVKTVPTADSWEDVSEPDGEEKRVAVNFPPSYHEYPIYQMMHTHQRKGLILMLLTAFVVIAGVAVIILYVVVYNRRRQRAIYNRVELSPEEREIVRNSANRLGQIVRPVKRFQFAPTGFKPLIDSQSDLSLAITENPLESYLLSDPGSDPDSTVVSDSKRESKGETGPENQV